MAIEMDCAPSGFPVMSNVKSDLDFGFIGNNYHGSGSSLKLSTIKTDEAGYVSGEKCTTIDTQCTDSGLGSSLLSRDIQTDRYAYNDEDDINTISSGLGKMELCEKNVNLLQTKDISSRRVYSSGNNLKFGSDPLDSKHGCHGSHYETKSVPEAQLGDVQFDELSSKWDLNTDNFNTEVSFCQDKDGDNILHIAIIFKLVVVVKYILGKLPLPWFLNLQNKLGQTPLHLGVITDQPEVTRDLLLSGVSPHVQDRNGNTALHLACMYGHLQCVQALLRPLTRDESYRITPRITTLPKPDIRIYNYDGKTCVHLAASSKHLDILEYLVDGPVQADLSLPDGTSGRTILHHAVESGDHELVSFLTLRTSRINLNARTYEGFTAYHLAYGRERWDMVRDLENAGANNSVAYLESLLSYSSSEDLSD